MPHDMTAMLSIAVSLAAALTFGFATHRLGLSPIVGYLMAGMAVGPFTPGFVAQAGLAEQLAEVGVILLMFGVGLHLQLQELLAVRRVAIPGALVQIVVAVGLGTVVALAFGSSVSAGLVYGVAISVASTVVLLRVLAGADLLRKPVGHVAVGWLIVEDLFTVLVLVILPVLFGGAERASPMETATSIAWAMIKVALLVAFTLIAGHRAIPALLGYVARTRSQELFTLTILTFALGIAVASAQLFGTSMALGAFLAGLVVGQSHYGVRAASDALPLRDAFSVLFFVSIGMMFDVTELRDAPGLIAATLGIVLVGKPLAALAMVLILGRPLNTAIVVAAALAQVGEFTFVLSSMAVHLGILPARFTQVLIAAAIVSISLNPLLFKALRPLTRWIAARSHGTETREPQPNRDEALGDAIVIGHGRIGSGVTRLLQTKGVQLTVIDLDVTTVNALRQRGLRAVHGNASDPTTLAAAGVAQADIVISTVARANEAIVLATREINPSVRVIARSIDANASRKLRLAGADYVITDEAEVAMAFAERVVERFGATPEQLAEERGRIRVDFDM